ncbi:MAG: hypothetical protein R3D98_15935 [Candidatus Krumholzibacteriia bacterium]
MRLRPLALLLLLLVLTLVGCGKDDAIVDPPPADTGLRVPEDYATLYDALAAAGLTDEVSLAPGAYTVDASLDRGVTVRARRFTAGEVRLLDSRLTVRAPAGDRVVLEGLTMIGGDTLVSAPGGADLALVACRLVRATLGVLYTVDGDLDLVDCDLDSLGRGGAVHVGGQARLTWQGGAVRACTADQAVIDLRDEARASIASVTFVDCPRYTIRHRGLTLELDGCGFVQATGPSLAVGAGAVAHAGGTAFLDSAWPAIEVAGQLTLDPCLIAGGLGDGPAIQLNAGGALFMVDTTVHDGAGPALTMAAGAAATVSRSLLTWLAAPLATGAGATVAALTFDNVDAWAPGLSAWSGLEAMRDAGQGNRETDPLYCSPDDLRLQAGSPVAGWGGLQVGCQ